jgi:hypothetical protein
VEGFIKLDLSEMDAALALGLVVVTGVSLNPQADQQVQSGQPWDIGPDDQPDPNEGHAILYIKADSASGPYSWASWGQQVVSTYAWRQACPQQAFGVITDPDFLEANGFPTAQLVADLTELNATVNPLPAPVAPPATNAGEGTSVLAEPAEGNVAPPQDVDNPVGDTESFLQSEAANLAGLFKSLHSAMGHILDGRDAAEIANWLRQEISHL